MSGQNEIEQRFAEGVAHDGRTITASMPYGETALVNGQFLERIEAGALYWKDAILNAMHQRTVPLARTGGGGLEIEDSPEALSMRAELPNTTAASDALELVRTGVYRGISIEFRAEQQTIENSPQGKVRVIRKAELVGIALADRPVYKATSVAARMMATVDSLKLPNLSWLGGER